SGKEWTLRVDDDSDLRLGARPAKLSDFKVGTRVRVRYAREGGRRRVVLMRPQLTAGALGRDVRDFVRRAKDFGYEKRREYVEKAGKALDELNERIEDLQDRVESGRSAELKELRKKRDALRERLARLRKASPAAWATLKAGVARGMDELQKAYERAAEKVK